MSQINLNKLFEMIEEIVDAKTVIQEQENIEAKEEKTPKGVPYPRLALNRNWGADPTNEDRKTVNKFVAQLAGSTLEEKIQSLGTFLEGCKEDCINQKNIPQAIASIVILDALASLVFDFNARPAGDLFESFLSALQGDVQTGGSGRLPDIGIDLSAKLIKKGTDVTGATRNLEAILNPKPTEENPEPVPGNINYLIAAKVQSAKAGPLVVEFYKFNIPTDISSEEIVLSRDKKQFAITAEQYEKFPVATLDIGTQKDLRGIAQEYLNNLDSRITVIYESLGTLSNQLNKYFVENDSSGATAAQQTANELKVNIEKLS